MDSLIDQLNAARSNVTTSEKPTGFSAMDAQAFTKIIFSELSKQDPLEPTDTKALLEQISTIRSIQSDTDLTDKLQSLISQNEFASSAGLIGKEVSGISEFNTRVTGLVKGVSRTSAGPVLTLDTGARISMGNLDSVLETTPPAPTTPTTPTTADTDDSTTGTATTSGNA